MPEIVPVLMVKNEEYWIRTVLRPLVAVFGVALLGDTGSTDDTVELARSVAGVRVYEFGEKTPDKLPQVRAMLGETAKAEGADWCLIVDGDEWYCETTLRSIAAQLAC